jgi:hypothetical protein
LIKEFDMQVLIIIESINSTNGRLRAAYQESIGIEILSLVHEKGHDTSPEHHD